jgi:hypothetical protein
MGILFLVGLFGFRGCRCLRGIDCRRPEVDGTYGESAVVEKPVYFVYLAWRSSERGFEACG